MNSWTIIYNVSDLNKKQTCEDWKGEGNVCINNGNGFFNFILYELGGW